MKKVALSIVAFMVILNSWAQDNKEKEQHATKNERKDKGHTPLLYITLSTGVNNNTAIMGFNLELPVTKNITVEAGPGTGTWGNKLYGGVKYYTRPAQRGFAAGLGIAYCPGVRYDEHDLETIYGNTEKIQYHKNPQTVLLLMLYKYWTLGRKYNRFYIETGWAQILNGGEKITQLSGHTISDKQRDRLNSAIENAPIFAVGISFGLH